MKAGMYHGKMHLQSRPATPILPMVILLHCTSETDRVNKNLGPERRSSHPFTRTRAADSQGVDRARRHRSPGFPLELSPAEGSQGRLRSGHKEGLALLCQLHALHLLEGGGGGIEPETDKTLTSF